MTWTIERRQPYGTAPAPGQPRPWRWIPWAPAAGLTCATTTIYLSAETRTALTATLRPGESRSAYVAAAIEREAAARRDEPTGRPPGRGRSER